MTRSSKQVETAMNRIFSKPLAALALLALAACTGAPSKPDTGPTLPSKPTTPEAPVAPVPDKGDPEARFKQFVHGVGVLVLRTQKC